MDNYPAHKHAKVRHWLTAHPRFKVHFTPTHASWMNLVEVWFSLVERQAVRRGVSKSVADLNAKVRAFVDGWNQRAHPFVWTKTAEEAGSVSAKVIRGSRTVDTAVSPRHVTNTPYVQNMQYLAAGD